MTDTQLHTLQLECRNIAEYLGTRTARTFGNRPRFWLRADARLDRGSSGNETRLNYQRLGNRFMPYQHEIGDLRRTLQICDDPLLRERLAEINPLNVGARRYINNLTNVESTLIRISPGDLRDREDVQRRFNEYQGVHHLLGEATSRDLTPENLREVSAWLENAFRTTSVSMSTLRGPVIY